MMKFVQAANGHEWIEREVTEVVAQGRTRYQRYLFFRSPVHGLGVALDGDIQSMESDEAVYHEALVHPAMLLHPEPRRVLIMGGGEGATAREVLKHPSVESVVMVDLDEEFVNLCRRLLPGWSAGAFEDPRLTVHHEDINTYLASEADTFDVVIGDLVDMLDPSSAAAPLYSEAMYRRLAARLSDAAIVATQAGALVPNAMKGHRHIRQSLSQVFPSVRSYGMAVPSFFHLWGYALASVALPKTSEADSMDVVLPARAEARQLVLPGTGGAFLARAFTLPSLITRHFV